MDGKKVLLYIEAQAESAEKAKELLHNLEALSVKYEVTINLKIYPGLQASYTQI